MYESVYRTQPAESLPLLPPQAAAFASDYDQFFWYSTVVITVASLIVFGMLAVFCVRYARRGPDDRTPRILGSTKVEVVWTVVPFLFFLTFFVWGVKLYNEAVTIPADAPEYFVVGKQWMWKIQHPDGQREINELHIPVGRPVKLTLTSEDVIHDFFVPAFRTKIDVIPGRYVQIWFQPTKIGRFHLFCSQYC